MSGCGECGRRRTALWHAERTVRDRVRVFAGRVESGRMRREVAAAEAEALRADVAAERAKLAAHQAECSVGATP